jgi:hypothetical protein
MDEECGGQVAESVVVKVQDGCRPFARVHDS